MAEKEISIIHPRPSSIVAALYTLRDLNVDVAILHGVQGSSVMWEGSVLSVCKHYPSI